MPAGDISVRELARTTGVSHAAPYRHFGDRAGFLAALTARCLGEFVDAQEAALAAAPVGEWLPAVGAAYVAFAVEHPHVFGLVYAARGERGEADVDLGAAVDRHVALLGAAVDDASAAGLLPVGAEPPDVAAALWSLAHGLAHLVGAGFLPVERVDAVLRALLRP